LYELVGPRLKRAFDIAAYTINLLFLGLFGYAMTFKVYDILRAGEISAELRIPVWTGYTLASLGVLTAVAMAAIRWWQVVVDRR
jgi:TRAP-type C4-dicarboxylate transport system permease small subunit